MMTHDPRLTPDEEAKIEVMRTRVEERLARSKQTIDAARRTTDCARFVVDTCKGRETGDA